DVIHGLELTSRVEVPDDGAVGGRIRPEVAIHRPGEHDTWNHRCRRRLRAGAAAAGVALQLRRGRMPDLLAGAELEREEAAGLVRRREDIRHRNIRCLVVGRGAPFDAAERATLTALNCQTTLPSLSG